jgi:hypothetical protein
VVAEAAQCNRVNHRLEARGQFAEGIAVAGLRGLDQVLECGRFVLNFVKQSGHGSLESRKRDLSSLEGQIVRESGPCITCLAVKCQREKRYGLATGRLAQSAAKIVTDSARSLQRPGKSEDADCAGIYYDSRHPALAALEATARITRTRRHGGRHPGRHTLHGKRTPSAEAQGEAPRGFGY